MGAKRKAVIIGAGKMGKDALHVQIRQSAVGADILHTGSEMGARAEISQAGHPRIHLDVDFQRTAAAHRLCAVLHRLLIAGHRLCDVVFDQLAQLRQIVPALHTVDLEGSADRRTVGKAAARPECPR